MKNIFQLPWTHIKTLKASIASVCDGEAVQGRATESWDVNGQDKAAAVIVMDSASTRRCSVMARETATHSQDQHLPDVDLQTFII